MPQVPARAEHVHVLRATILRIGVGVVVVVTYLFVLFHYVSQQFIAHTESIRRAVLVEMVGLARNTIEPIIFDYRNHKYGREEALVKVRDLVRKMVYKNQYGDNYIFMSSFDGTMLVQPFEPIKELTNQLDLKDIHGKFIIKALIEMAKSAEGEGFVSYYYYPPGSKSPQEKLAYVKGIPELGCYIGTGTYLLKAQIEQAELLQKAGLWSMFSIVLLLVPIAISIRELVRHNRVLALEVAERKRAEQERELLQAQLLQAQKMESIGRLAGGVAHDFNNLLTAITGYTEIILSKSKEIPEKITESLFQIQKAASRAKALTMQLLAFGRKQVLETKSVDLNKVIKDFNVMMRRIIGESIQIKETYSADLWPTMVDQSQIEQVLMNLSVNARDAMPEGGAISYETKNSVIEQEGGTPDSIKPGRYVVVKVSDTGQGLSQAAKAHLFEPFFTTKEKGQGTGLGLATVYGIIKQHDGYVMVDSQPGKGCSFSLYLPASESEDYENIGKTEEASLSGSSAGGILLVEDDEMVRNLVKHLLEVQGYSLWEASNLEEAVKLATKHRNEISLLLSDVILAQQNGRMVYEKVLEICPGIKVLFMSGYSDEIVAPHGVLQEGFNYIQKPFSTTDLLQKVRKVLSA